MSQLIFTVPNVIKVSIIKIKFSGSNFRGRNSNFGYVKVYNLFKHTAIFQVILLFRTYRLEKILANANSLSK